MTQQLQLNRQLVLEEAQTVPDGSGGVVETWIPLGTLWAHVKSGTGREMGVDFATVSTVAYRITVRAAPFGAVSRPKPDQRFVEGGRVFRITAVTEADAAARFLICFAYEEVSA